MASKKDKITYEDSGVNISKGNTFVKNIQRLAKSTQNNGVMGSIGAFSALFDPKPFKFKDPILVAATDGVGTKIDKKNQ